MIDKFKSMFFKPIPKEEETLEIDNKKLEELLSAMRAVKYRVQHEIKLEEKDKQKKTDTIIIKWDE